MAYFGNLAKAILGQAPPAVSPFKTSGDRGTAIFGGYVQVIERNRRLAGTERFRTSAEIMANASIVAAGLRFFLNLVGKPNWSVEPAEDNGPGEEPSDASKEVAEFIESCLYDMETNWVRIQRRWGLYRFHGFGIHEWTAKRRDDGRIGLLDIEPRPCHTIERWELDPKTNRILGSWQRSPDTNDLAYLPRSKTVYLVDDALTDSPEGMGLLRHLADPYERLKEYLRLERIGYQRDLRGVPLGQAPFAEIRAAVANGDLTEAEGEALTQPLEKFIKLQVKGDDTGLLIDSSTYTGQTDAGEQPSTAKMWGMDLLKGEAASFADIGKAIDRISLDMARIMGVENLIVGSAAGGGGSRALSEDKSRNLYLQVNSAVGDQAEAAERDIVAPIMTLNGWPMTLKPTLKAEDVSPKDVEQIAATLRDMATAGAVLAPDDPAIDDVRDLLGVSRQAVEAVDRALESEQLGLDGQRASIDAKKNPPEPAPGGFGPSTS